MLVSVVAPCYNHEQYIRACIASLAIQSYRNIELILIDDCSLDASFDVAQEVLSRQWLRGRFQRIEVERNSQNLGAAQTLNRAIAKARGEVIFIINTDDLYAPERIELVLDRLGNTGFAFTGVCPIDETGSPSYTPRSLEFRAFQDRISAYPFISASLLSANRAISTGNFCFNKDLFQSIGGFHDLAYCHDWHFILHACRFVEPIYIPQELYFYRLHSGNTFQFLSRWTGEHDGQYCLVSLFDAIKKGLVSNELLKAAFGFDSTREALFAANEPARVHWDKPNYSVFGNRPRSVHSPATGKPVGRIERSWLEESFNGDLLVCEHRGELSNDGQIAKQVEIRCLAAEGAHQLKAGFRLAPNSHIPRTVILELFSRNQLFSRASAVVDLEGTKWLSLDRPVEYGTFTLRLTVAHEATLTSNPNEFRVILVGVRTE
jgi:glycosyltransferase involved in cell wall biosynthesis